MMQGILSCFLVCIFLCGSHSTAYCRWPGAKPYKTHVVATVTFFRQIVIFYSEVGGFATVFKWQAKLLADDIFKNKLRNPMGCFLSSLLIFTFHVIIQWTWQKGNWWLGLTAGRGTSSWWRTHFRPLARKVPQWASSPWACIKFMWRRTLRKKQSTNISLIPVFKNC